MVRGWLPVLAWLDRARHWLYGPVLAEKLAWLETGDIIYREGTGCHRFGIAGYDAEIQSE